ncbi:hypothetical protein WHR41_06032 [Cladosporium halotolerans]|uniref:Uncharacterized protein n=1 Tax=Cladosporium halotolerans TaxID=1052096 RepID=A0AB34KKL3_9PEZI
MPAQFFAYDGYGQTARESAYYSQAVRIGNRIECAGQGGWNPATGSDYSPDLSGEIDQAFENVELAIRTAGGKGWSQVFRVTTYHVVLNDEVFAAMVRNLKAWIPDHQPIWTCIGVAKLAYPEMRVEIEVAALDE